MLNVECCGHGARVCDPQHSPGCSMFAVECSPQRSDAGNSLAAFFGSFAGSIGGFNEPSWPGELSLKIFFTFMLTPIYACGTYPTISCIQSYRHHHIKCCHYPMVKAFMTDRLARLSLPPFERRQSPAGAGFGSVMNEI